jgi:hypothetical protein
VCVRAALNDEANFVLIQNDCRDSYLRVMGMHLSSEECTVLHVLALYCTALHCCLPKGNWTRYLGRYILCLVHIVWAVSDKKYSAVLLRNAQPAQRSAAPERPRASPAVHTRRLCCRRGGPARQHRRRVERDRDLCVKTPLLSHVSLLLCVPKPRQARVSSKQIKR